MKPQSVSNVSGFTLNLGLVAEPKRERALVVSHQDDFFRLGLLGFCATK